MESEQIPYSKNVARVESKDYWITAAEWNNTYGSSYEIGIRHKVTDAFELLQSGWNDRTVRIAALAVATLLDSDLTIQDVRDVLTP